MICWLKKYWPEVLTFGGISSLILIAVSPNLTWMMVDSDGPEYVMDAINFYPAHHTSAPLYLLMGHVFEMIPFGSEYWRMSLMSWVFTIGTMLFLYFIVRRLIQGDKGRWYGLLAALIFGGSMLAFAQAIIVETYAVVTFFSVAAYYFTLRKNWVMTSIMLGCGLVTHHLIFLTWIVLFIAHKELRFNTYKVFGKQVSFFSKYFLLSAAFLIFYLYIPLSVRFTDQPNMWGNTGFKDFFQNNIGVFTMLVGQLSIYDFPKRVLDTLGVLGVSFAIAIIPLAWWIWKYKKVRNELLWLFLLPIAYWISDLAPQTCFPAGTTILTKKRISGKNGKMFEAPIPVPIERLQVGDMVLSYNEELAGKEYKRINHIFVHDAKELVTLTLSNDNELRCTPEHPIAVNRHGNIQWTRATDIQIGDEVIQYKYRGLDGRLSSIRVRGQTPEERFGAEEARVYREVRRQQALASYRDPNSKMHSLERRQRMSDGIKRAWANPASNCRTEETKQKHIAYLKAHPALGSEKAKAKVRATKKKQWQDSAFAKMMMKSWKRHPNKAEMKLERIIDGITADFKYNGNVEQGVVIGGMIPDFVNVNGKKKLIELFGTWWHRGENPQDRIGKLGQFGYDTLVIWEHELKDIDAVTQRIKDFMFNPKTVVVKVVAKTSSLSSQSVYNLEVADNNNFFAYGILVHNCKYMEASIAWGAIMAVLLLSQVNKKWLVSGVTVGAVVMLGVNTWTLDIGRTLDPNLSATEFYQQELPKMQDGDIFVTNGAWEWILVFMYNKETGHHIIPVCMGILPSDRYRTMLRDQGVVIQELENNPEYQAYTGSHTHNLNTQQVFYSLSIVENNKNVFTSRPTDPSTYGAEVVPAPTNTDQFTRWLGHDITVPKWQWKPSSPYAIVLGTIEVQEWVFILQSNRTVIWLATLLGLGYTAAWASLTMWKRRKKKESVSAN